MGHILRAAAALTAMIASAPALAAWELTPLAATSCDAAFNQATWAKPYAGAGFTRGMVLAQ